MFDLATLDALVALAERSGAVLLVDETYRDLTHGEPLPVAATRSPRVISVSSMSKAYGLPGLRIGWAICRDRGSRASGCSPPRSRCSSAVPPSTSGSPAPCWPPGRACCRRSSTTCARASAIVRDWMAAQSTFEWVEPTGGVVGLVRARADVPLDTDRFYDVLLAEHGTYVGPGHWFEVDDRHFRLGYGWPTEAELRAGLAGLTAAAEAAVPAT